MELAAVVIPALLVVPVGLATWSAVNLWLLGSIFAPARARLAGTPPGRLLLCRFCLTYHVGLWPTAAWAAATGSLDFYQTVVVSLAAVAVCQLLDELVPGATAEAAPPPPGSTLDYPRIGESS